MQLAREYKYGAQIKLPIYDGSSVITKGQSLIWGQDASGTGTLNALVDSSAVPIDIFAIAAEGLTTTVTNYQTPLIKKAIVQLVNIVPVWKIYFDVAAGNDISVTSSTSTVVTHSSGDDNLDGAWIYINSGTGVGQLRYCKAAAATTKTVNTAFTTIPDSTSDYILIRGQGRPTGGVDLDSTFSLIKSTVSQTGQLLILKNYVQGPMGTQELDVTANPGLEVDGLNSRGVRFYSDVIFMDTFFSVDSIA